MDQFNYNDLSDDMKMYVDPDEKSGDNKIAILVNKSRSFILTFIGIIMMVVGIIVIFVISSLEGTKEVKASNSDSAKIIEIWRNEHEELFPEERAEIIEFNSKEYYFSYEYNKNNEIVGWYFAYDGGFEYIFGDFKFYVLTALAISISLFVAHINYLSTANSSKRSKQFISTLLFFQKRKEEIKDLIQYVPEFCIDKNREVYEDSVTDIVEMAGITKKEYYSFINFDNIINTGDNQKIVKKQIKEERNKRKLKYFRWQLKTLNKVKRIKIKRITSSDLLQEKGSNLGKINILPMGQDEHHKRFMIFGFVNKLITSSLSGMIIAFGVILGNWFLGLIYAFGVLMSAVTAVIVSADFVQNTLRNRYIAKADLFQELSNKKEKYIKKENIL